MYITKTKRLISYEVTAQLICTFVLAYAKSRFSHDVAHLNHSCKCHLLLFLFTSTSASTFISKVTK